MSDYKLLLFTDYHISSKGRRTLRRLEECVNTSTWIASEVEKHSPNAVVNLGDSFDNHSNLDVPSLCTGVRVMETIMKACTTVGAKFIIIPGNHDAYSRDYSSLEAFQGLGAEVVWEPTVYDGMFGALPFNKNAGVATHWILDLEKKSKVVLAHIDVAQASFFSGHESDVGVDADAFRGPIFAGHYHHPHKLGAFEFIGSVLHHNFSDKVVDGAPRGLVVVTLSKAGKVKKVERIANPHTTIYHKIDWSKKKEQLQAIRYYGRFDGRMHLRVKCDYKQVKQVRSDISEMFPDLLTCAIVGVNTDTQDVERLVTVKVDSKPEDALKAYLKNKGIPKGLDEDTLLTMGKAFLED